MADASRHHRRSKGAGSRVNIREMMNKRIPEAEILAEWLQRLCLSEYLSLFIAQGYDLISISRITPEDLTTLGISKPEDRKRLFNDIQNWNIADIDNWPAQVSPDTGIRDWLFAIGLTHYIDDFESQGYLTMNEIEKVTWEDLEDIGVTKLGHMKRICLALKKLRLHKVGKPALPAQPYADGTLRHHTMDHEYSATLNRRQQSTMTGQPRLSMPTMMEETKQRPVVEVRPNQQPSAIEQLTDEKSAKGPPRLNLFKTSQILSEYSAMPVSLAGVQMDPHTEYEMIMSQQKARRSPPPPAPMPYNNTNNNGYTRTMRTQLKETSFSELDHMISDLSSELDSILVSPTAQQKYRMADNRLSVH